MKLLSERITTWRQAAGLTQEMAARAFLVSIQAFRTWEQGTNEPTGKRAGLVNQVLERFEALAGTGR